MKRGLPGHASSGDAKCVASWGEEEGRGGRITNRSVIVAIQAADDVASAGAGDRESEGEGEGEVNDATDCGIARVRIE
jgi:hypothetical protein